MKKSIAKLVNEGITQPKYGLIPPKHFDCYVKNDHNKVRMGAEYPYQIVTKVLQLLIRKNLVNKPLSELQLAGVIEANDTVYYVSLFNQLDHSLTDENIKRACELASYDIIAVSHQPKTYPVKRYDPDEDAINDIRTMVIRCLNYFTDKNVVDVCVTFPSAYNDIIESGTLDVLTRTSVCNIRINKSGMTNKDSLQTCIGYLLTEKEKANDPKSVHHDSQPKTLEIFNPRYNKVYILPIEKIKPENLDRIKSLTGLR